MKTLIILLVVFMHQFTTAQTNRNDLYIHFSLDTNYCNAYFPYNCTIGDTTTFYLSDSTYFNYQLTDCMGASKLTAYLNNRVVIEGYYSNSIDTFKHCVVVNDSSAPNNSMVVKSERYLEPLKDGVWKYYNNVGIVIREEHWDKGILLHINK